MMLLAVSAPASARQFQVDFDGPETSWQVRCRNREAQLDTQERRREGARRGKSEFIRIQSAVENGHSGVQLRQQGLQLGSQ